MDSKVFSLSGLNRLKEMSVSLFLEEHKKVLVLEKELFTTNGCIRIFSDNNNVKYTIEYIRGRYDILEPHKLLRICNVIVDMIK